MKKSQNTVICEDIEGKTYKVPIDQLTFRPAVYGVIIENEKILLSKQWDGYDFPGGGIELGEATEDALIREVKEETGLSVKMGKILHAEHSFFKLPFHGNYVHSIHLYYECKTISGKLSTNFLDDNERKYAQMPEWLALGELENVKIYSSGDYRKVLASILS